jgi:hypothetical protein
MFKFTIVFFVSLLLMGSAFSQITTSEVAGPVDNSNAMYYNHGSHVARTSDGKLFVVWATDGNSDIMYSQYDDAFQTWSPPVAISNNPAGGTAAKTAIAADDNGNLYVVWQQRENSSSNYAIMLSKYNGSSWSAPVDLSDTTSANEEANVAVSNDGKIFVVWNTDSESDGDEWILCIRSDDAGSTWSSPPDTLSSPDGVIGGTSVEAARVNLARGSGGRMVATWFETQTVDDIFMNQFDGSQWSGEMVVTDTSTVNNRYPWAALDNSDNINIVWRGRISGEYGLQIKHKAWNDLSWPAAFDVVVDTGFGTARPTMVIDNNENLYVAYQRYVLGGTIDEIALVTSTDGGATWSNQYILSRANHDGGYQGMDPRVTSSGIDMAWRESYFIDQNDPDSLAIVYGHVDLSIVGFEEPQSQVVGKFDLRQNYPNPFNPTTQIKYSVNKLGNYELAVYNLLGEKVRTLISSQLSPGTYSIDWDGRNEFGKAVASGVYFYRLSGKDISIIKKMVLIR